MPRRHRPILVETVATLVIVAVVCAFLHEQGTRREAERRSAALDGLAGSVRASAALAHSMWIADGAGDGTVATAAGRTIDIDLLTGYPSATDDGIRGLVPALDGIAVERAGDSPRVLDFRRAGARLQRHVRDRADARRDAAGHGQEQRDRRRLQLTRSGYALPPAKRCWRHAS